MSDVVSASKIVLIIADVSFFPKLSPTEPIYYMVDVKRFFLIKKGRN